MVELTASGRGLFARAEAAALKAENDLTAELGHTGAARLRQLLRDVLAAEPQHGD